MFDNVLPKKIDYVYILMVILFIAFNIAYYYYWKGRSINYYALISYVILTFIASISLLKAFDD